MKRNVVLGLALVLLAGSCPESEAATGAAVLSKSFDPRAVGMGDAYTAVADDSYSIYYNPAGLSYLSQAEVSTVFSTGLVDDYLGQLSFASPASKAAAWGLGVLYYDGGSFDLVDGVGTTQKLSAQRDWLFSLAGSWRATDNFRLGVTLEFLHSVLLESLAATTLALNLGASANLLPALRLDAAVRHLGLPLQYFSNQGYSGPPPAAGADALPVAGSLGAAYQVLASEPGHSVHDVLVAASGEWTADNQVSASLGAEYQYDHTLAVRAGYRFAQNLDGLSLGAGAKVPISNGLLAQLDFALEFSRDLSNRLLFGLSMLAAPAPAGQAEVPAPAGAAAGAGPEPGPPEMVSGGPEFAGNSSAAQGRAEAPGGNTGEAAGETNLVLRSGVYIPHAVVVSNQEGIVRFVYRDEDRVYRLKSEYLLAQSSIAPPDSVPVTPSAARQYMAEAPAEPAPERPAPKRSAPAWQYFDYKVQANRPPGTEAPEAPEPPPHPRIPAGTGFLFGDFGYSLFGMGDINAEIKSSNSVFKGLGFPLEPELSGGLGFNGGFAFWVGDNIALGLEVGYLDARTKGGNSMLSEDLDMSALEVTPMLKAGTQLAPGLSLTATLEIGFLSLTGAYIDDQETLPGYIPQHVHIDLSGWAVPIKTAVGLEYLPDPKVAEATLGFGVDLGYRQATITEVEGNLGGTTGRLYNANHAPLAIDYTGLYIQGGLRLYFP